jgi:peptide deformylase
VGITVTPLKHERMEYKFEIIPNQQTPAIQILELVWDEDVQGYIKEHREELEAFLEFASQQSTAVGLAANQCSLNGERFMVRAFALMNLITRRWSLIIDPVINEDIGIKEIKAEGCLTWKGQKVLAERFRAVEVDYFDMDGKRFGDEQVEVRKGFEGQIWQHEINHLNGIPEQVVPSSVEDPKPITAERNSPCPCGSGMKYKRCCLLLI